VLILLVTLHALHLRIAADLGGRSGLGVSLRAVQRSIHPGAKGESTMQQLRETCEPA